MSETLNAPMSKITKKIKYLMRHEAQKEAFDNLLANPQLRRLTRSQIRSLARQQVDKMFKEQRQLAREEALEKAAAPKPPDTTFSTNVPTEGGGPTPKVDQAPVITPDLGSMLEWARQATI